MNDINKIAEDLDEQEAVLADLLVAITQRYGKFNEDSVGVWAGYDSGEENDVADIGVKCANCVLYEGEGVCKIVAHAVEPEGKCRFAIIPDGVVQLEEGETMGNEMKSEDEMEDEEEKNGEEMDSEEEATNGEEEDMEEEDEEELEPSLKPRQQMHYEVLESIAEKYGKWDQTASADGAHYATAEENPFKDKGMICANCIFYEGGQGCEIVSGTIEPEAICKLWIIDESLLRQSE